MTTTPDYDDVIEVLRSALLAIYAVITPNKNKTDVSRVQSVDSRNWTTLFVSTTPDYEASSSGLLVLNETVVCVYRAGVITEGTDTEREAQRLKGVALLPFAQRPHLQSATFPNGVDAIEPNGETVTSARLASVESDTKKHWAVEITLNVPISINIDSDFDF